MFCIPTVEEIKAVMLAKGYTVFEDVRGYDLNLFGIRTADTESNTFNDLLGVFYVFEDRWNCFAFPGTTDPGLYWRKNPMNVNGTAFLKPGQYREVYKLGLHKGYPALQQQKPMTVYRDANRDSYADLDENNTQTGIFGINLHRASLQGPSDNVNKWSAGCQVVQDPIHFEFKIELVREAKAIYGNSFSYTLLEESDF